MGDARCWREVFIRGGMTTIIVAVVYFFLDASPWVWIAPPAVILLVVLKWAVRPQDLDADGPEGSDVSADSAKREQDVERIDGRFPR
jgi:hypothetical protein